MMQRAPQRARHAAALDESGVEGNARFTSLLAVILLILLALEGVTIPFIGPLLTEHVFIGVLLIPPVLYKIGSTTWRFVKYYTGDARYRRKGPPVLVLRLLGPVVVILTLAVIGSGIGLVLLPRSDRGLLLSAHQASFVLWFGAMTIHVLGHLVETAKLAPLDWIARTRRQVRGASMRQWAVASSLVLGVVAAAAITPYAANWFAQSF
ncbi:MAG: hypothetical protein ACYC5Z_00760 [Acidimicrobiales bacterium]